MAGSVGRQPVSAEPRRAGRRRWVILRVILRDQTRVSQPVRSAAPEQRGGRGLGLAYHSAGGCERPGADGGRQGKTWVGFGGEEESGDWNGAAALRGRRRVGGKFWRQRATVSRAEGVEGRGTWWADLAHFVPGLITV
jgi:hypothetical protein